MPTYEYQCQACGHQLEAVQRITEPALKDCPACSKPSLERLISGGAFHLKGGGWYKDGYGSQSGKKPRTDNDRIDRLTKAIDDDKKKTTEADSSAEASKPAASETASASTGSTGTTSGSASSSTSSTSSS